MIMILILTVVLFVQTLFFVKKNRGYLRVKNVEKEIEILHQQVEQDNIKIEKEVKERVLLTIKLREIINRRYHNKLSIYNRELNTRERFIKEKEYDLRSYNVEIEKKQKEYDELNEKKKELEKIINDIELDIYSAEYGLYRSKYYFLTSKKCKEKIEEVRKEQKRAIKNDEVCVCHTNWTIANSRREGNKMINRNKKMMLRAFNGECDAIISKATYKNVNTMEKRIIQSFERINKLNEVIEMWITDEYMELKLKELFLVHEYHEKMFIEKEEQRIIKAQMKDEEKAQKEFEKELIKAEKETERYSKALKQARKELQTSDNKSIENLNIKIQELERKLKEAEKNKRAISQAQITKSGHVYVISNIGSFGENVYKIGMTRRLEPLDRVKELNGPSVPFSFDIHAMIFSENAPELEKKLHRELSYTKLNRITKRKEFFYVKLDIIEKVVEKITGKTKLKFNYEHEAKEYRLSEKIRIKEERNTERLVG